VLAGVLSSTGHVDHTSDYSEIVSLPGENSIFRRVSIVSKSDYQLRHVCPYVRPSTWNNSAPTEWGFIKFDFQVFF